MPQFIESTDAAATTATTYALSTGQTAQGILGTAGDHDWFRVDLVAGQTYTFAMTGTGGNNVYDPFLRLYGSNGTTVVASNDDGLQGANSLITYTAATTGTYYIDAGAYNDGGAGQYGVSFTAGNRASFDLQMGAGVIDTDQSWSLTPGTGANVSYAFRLTDSGDETNFSQLSAVEQAAVQSVLAMYAEVCGLTFSQVNPGGYSDSATMLFSNYAANDGAGAYAYYPGDTTFSSRSGDVYLNTNSISTTSVPFGGYSYFAIAHEIGHAVGLSHPGLYNAGVGVVITYANNAQFTQDTHQYSIMSYFDESNTTGSYGSYPDTLMLYDVYALQQIYGANNSTRSGNTTYGFGSNAGSVYDFSINTNPALCIWDGGGTDTINCSGFTQGQVINLNGGTFSNIGALTGNVSIALGAIIENATGGSGNDSITGNEVANVLTGGAGNDTLRGGAGNDTLVIDSLDSFVDGGADIDTVNLTGAGMAFNLGYTNVEIVNGTSGNDQVDGSVGTTGMLTLNGLGGNDTLSGGASGDSLSGGDAADSLYGNAGNDTLNGGAGLDFLNGGADADTINGGTENDTIYGEAGNDTINGDAGNEFAFGGTGNDSMTGGTGNDYLVGDSNVIGETTITGADTLVGGDDSDTLIGGYLSDSLNGGLGNDALYGDFDDVNAASNPGSADTLIGGAGTDFMFGGGGNDSLVGDADGDTLIGGSENDTMNGGEGSDSYYGQSGVDTFVFGDNWGIDGVWDFADGSEIFDLTAVTGLTTFAQLTITNQSAPGINYADIAFGVNHIYVVGVTAAQLTAVDFLL